MIRRLATTLGLVAALILFALPALGHVTVETDNAEPGGFAVYTVRVPNESDTASTIRVEVQMPEGLQVGRYRPNEDWTMSLDDGALVIEGGAIAPGEFEEFRFQARNPEAAAVLTFAAIQTYDDGEVVNWTGEPDSDTPAAVVEIGGVSTSEASGDATESTDALTVVALALGGLGVLLGAVGLFRSFRS